MYCNWFTSLHQGGVKGAAGEEEEGLSSPGWLWGQNEWCMLSLCILTFWRVTSCFLTLFLILSVCVKSNESNYGKTSLHICTEVQLHMRNSDQLVGWKHCSDFYCCFQKWRKELAKNREKLLGGSDKDKEKDKKTTDKEKEEKKEKKEVWNLKHQTSEWSHS